MVTENKKTKPKKRAPRKPVHIESINADSSYTIPKLREITRLGQRGWDQARALAKKHKITLVRPIGNGQVLGRDWLKLLELTEPE